MSVKLGDEDALYMSLPPNLQTAENYALSYAVDMQLRKLMELARKISIWSDCSRADARYYDNMAAMLRTPYYNASYADDVRLNLIKGTFKTYMFAGTQKAIEDLLEQIFGVAQFVPWYEYGGQPYHFKIIVPIDPTEEMLSRFIEILERVKSARSIIDRLETKTYEFDINIILAMGAHDYGSLIEQGKKGEQEHD